MVRVVVTGMAGLSPIGLGWEPTRENLLAGRNGIVFMEDWNRYPDLRTRLGGPAVDFELPKHYTRKVCRSMGRVALMSTLVSEMAIKDAGLRDHPVLQSGRAGVAYGSSTGSPPAIADFAGMIISASMDNIKANSYIKMMPHTAPINIALFFGIRGRIIPTSSACASGSLAIGYAYEAIKMGKQKVMIAGGGEELCPTEAAVFDTLYATSTQNETPDKSPRPFDANRDGLVIGEGAGTLILEELEFAKARGANIIAEVVGFGANSDGKHVTQPTQETMKIAMELALEDAALQPEDIGYINGHGTATQIGDISETLATAEIFGNKVPFSTLKGHIGHTLGACGGLEAWMILRSMNENWFAPTLNLETVDEKCGDLDYIKGDVRALETEYIMSNNFAFGGMNTSLIFKRFQ